MPYQLKFIFDFGFPILDFTSPVPHTFQRSHRYLHLGESAFSFANAVRNWSSLLTNPELPSSVQAAPVRKILRTPNSELRRILPCPHGIGSFGRAQVPETISGVHFRNIQSLS
jgi:hypothetical protein